MSELHPVRESKLRHVVNHQLVRLTRYWIGFNRLYQSPCAHGIGSQCQNSILQPKPLYLGIRYRVTRFSGKMRLYGRWNSLELMQLCVRFGLLRLPERDPL
jgi:hypothetical protein